MITGGRWTYNLTQQYLTQDNPDLNGWLPEKGGILYSSDMTIFYQTFFKNPNADWRYILGLNPALMPDEDFKVFHSIMWNFGDAKAYEPWVKKMRPQTASSSAAARAAAEQPQLEWEYGVSGIWIGRTPRIPQSGTPPPDHSRNAAARHFNQFGEFSEVTAVEFSRQIKILFRQTAGVVRGERERHPVPADVNVRMMPRPLGEFGNRVDKFHRGGEILERIRPRNRRAFFFQSGTVASAVLIFSVLKFSMPTVRTSFADFQRLVVVWS
jgi:hypothetical protein